MNDFMTEHDPFRTRQGRDQVALDRDRLKEVGESESKDDAFDVGIDDDPGGNVERGADHDVRGLAADTRQLRQCIEIGGDFAVVFFDQPRGHAYQILGFGAKKPHERMIASSSAGSAAASPLASGYRAKRAGVTRLTRTSVHCAERMTATMS